MGLMKNRAPDKIISIPDLNSPQKIISKGVLLHPVQTGYYLLL